jgi:hypothetical protein
MASVPPVRFSNEMFEGHATFVGVILADCLKKWQPSECCRSALSDNGKEQANTNYGHFGKLCTKRELMFMIQKLQTWLELVETSTSRQNLYLCNELYIRSL